MSENNINEIAEKILVVKTSVGAMDFGTNKEIGAAITEIVNCLSDIAKELLLIKTEVTDANKNYDVLTERVNDIEEYIEESEYFDEEEEGVVAKIACPYCKSEVVIGEEFLTAEDPKVICQSCKNEIEVITSPCGCGCEEGEECDCEDGDCGCGDDCDCEDGDCGCGDDCDCGEEEDCEEDNSCGGGCGCGGKH